MGFLTSIVLGGLATRSFEQSVEAEIASHLSSVASLQKQRIETFVRHSRELMQLTASRTQLRLTLKRHLDRPAAVHVEKITRILRDAKQSIPAFEVLLVTDSKGDLVASTDPLRLEPYDVERMLAAEGMNTPPPPVYSTDRDSGGTPIVRMHAPLVLDGETIGWIIIDANASELVGITGSYAGLGESGETLLAERLPNGDARFLTPLRFDSDAALQQTMAAGRTDLLTVRALSGQSGFHRDTLDYREVPVLAVTTYIPDVGWGVVIKVDHEEAGRGYHALRAVLVKSVSAVLALAVLAAFLLSRSISHPIETLTDRARRIRQGERDLRTDHAGGFRDHETRELALAFDQMTQELLETFDAAPNGMLVTDPAGRIRRCNKETEKIFGYGPGSLRGQSIAVLLPDLLRQQHVRYWSRYAQHTETRLMRRKKNLLGRRQDGSEVQVEIGLASMETVDQTLVLATVVDITERQKLFSQLDEYRGRLEIKVAERTRELSIANKRVSLATRAAEIGIWEYNLEDGSVVWDQYMYQLYGVSPEEFSGTHAAWESRVHPDDLERAAHELQLAIQGEKPFDTEFRIQTPDGETRWTKAFATNLADGDGNLLRMIGTNQNITARKEAEAALIQARADAEQASRAKSAFLATMSHEIRTPMNGVIGMVDVLAHTPLTQEQGDLVGTVRESANSLLGVIDDILDFSKIEAGRLEIEQAPVSVPDLVEGLCSSLVPVAVTRDVDFDVFVSPEMPEQVLSDDVRLRQVLYNLVGNAIKFSAGRPGLRGHVSVRAKIADPDPLRLTFRVADNGIGIAPEILDELFTPFSQAEISTTRRFGGTGLGLAICQRLVELMGGEIAVQSTPGTGSTFTVTLPFERASEQPVCDLPDVSGIDCILVEEGDLAVDDLTIYLEHAGARVHHAADGSAAAALARGHAEPVVVIQELGAHRKALDAVSTPEPNLRCLLLTRGRRRSARVASPDIVTLDGDALRRQALLRAVAVAAGRASPEMFHPSVEEHAIGLATAPPTVAEARAQGRLILMAEDDTINQKVILRQLALLGYAAEVASNGEEALGMWREGHYALVLTDLHMPRMDGYTLAESIRREEGGRGRMPILALTANALRGEANRARAAGMDEYVIKPAPLELLKTTLEKWLPRDGSATPPSAPTEVSEASQAAPVMDVAVLKSLVGDDAEVVDDFLSQFLTTARRLAEESGAALAAGELHEVGAIAHKLKSASRSVGALALGDLCAELENAGRAEDKALIGGRMPQFEEALTAVEAEIDGLLAKC